MKVRPVTLTLCAGVVALLSGCTTSVSSDPPTAPTPVLEESSPPVTDPASTPSPTAAESSALATTASFDQYLGELARQAGYETPPRVQVRQVLLDGLQQSDLVHECLTEAGFTRNPDDGQISIASGQDEDFWRAMYTCNASYPLDDRVYEPLTDSQIRFYRDFWIESTIPCYAEHGYDIAQPPSAETVVGTWEQLGDKYHPQFELEAFDIPFAEVEALIRSCPDAPPMNEIWEH